MPNNKFEISLSVRSGQNNTVIYFHEQVVGQETRGFYAQYIAGMLVNYILTQIGDVLNKYSINALKLTINNKPINLNLFHQNHQQFSIELYRQIISGLTQEANK